ncbi:MAG: hypothetical protein WC373_08035 [Smithella sp.]|jgi:hypothetical protein
MPRIVWGTREGKNANPQLNLFVSRGSAVALENRDKEVISNFKNVDIHFMSPLEALNKLSELNNELSD